MKFYHIHVFFGGVQVSISAVKNDRKFYQTISEAIYKRLAGYHFMIKVYNGGFILESNSLPETFLGSTIPVVYQNRKLELWVYPEELTM